MVFSDSRLPDVTARVRREAARAVRMVSRLRVLLTSPGKKPDVSPLPVAGYPPGAPAGYVEQLDDEELAVVNGLLPWRCYTIDGHGRRLGDRARSGKRENPQVIPDWRVEIADERFGLAGKSVLEVGCFEGVHTIALCRRAGDVTAIDSHVINVVKTVVRCNLYGHRPTVYTSDVGTWRPDPAFVFDVVFHVGVLYHLFDPVPHVVRLGEVCRVGLLLDTHVATENQATETMTVRGRDYRFHRYGERIGHQSVFSGMQPESRWLLLDDLIALLHGSGFATVEVVDERDERNGKRVTLAATRTPRS